jgi:hypothetical protein
MSEREKKEGVVLIYEPTEEYLNPRQRIAYREHRRKYIDWLANEGKDPDALEGYAEATYTNFANITCKFHRFAWNRTGSFTLTLSHELAEQYLKDQKKSGDYSSSHLHNIKLALKAYFRYVDREWNPDIVVKSPTGRSQPKDYVTDEEREALREAVLEYGSVPAYAALDPDKRQQWKRYLARRFSMPQCADALPYLMSLLSGADAG